MDDKKLKTIAEKLNATVAVLAMSIALHCIEAPIICPEMPTSYKLVFLACGLVIHVCATGALLFTLFRKN